MPLVAHSDLPTFAQLENQGHELLSLERAVHQDIRELHIGFLNMMPDAALQATERQFIRLVGACNRIAQFFVYPFSLPELDRSRDAREYIARYYNDFGDLKEQGLDALVITGANVANPALEQEAFWTPLIEVVEWAEGNVASILCSCLATHALLKRYYGIDRQPLPEKRWGVYSHRVTAPRHPLLREINTRFDTPHSRHNDISRSQLEAHGLKVLVESHDGGVHMAVSPDQFRVVYFQGHPEYDYNSLLKEYLREVRRFLGQEVDARPPFPENYLPEEARRIAARFLEQAAGRGDPDPAAIRDLEAKLGAMVDNTWGDTAKAIVNNWLGLVYQLTNMDRTKQFMDGIDPDDPLGLKHT
jgi:homoserine O-succinyltransferase